VARIVLIIKTVEKAVRETKIEQEISGFSGEDPPQIRFSKRLPPKMMIILPLGMRGWDGLDSIRVKSIN
jgi:hypothetical protein